MSGFGGGGFGTPNQGSNSSNNPFGSGGGFGASSGTPSAAGGFGNSSGTSTSTPFGGGGSGGFGTSSGFGGSNSNANSGFGSSPSASATFGGSGGSSSFGNSNGGGGMSFGTSPNVVTTAGSSGFGGGSGSGFGGRSSFASQSRQQQNNTPSSSFGNTFARSSPPSSFGGPKLQAQQSSVTFGASSNVVVNQKSGPTFGGGGSTGSPFGGGGGSSGFGGSNNSSGFGKSGGTGFGGQSSGASGFGQPSSFNKNNSSSGGNPFVQPTQSTGGSNNPFAGGTAASEASPFVSGGAQPFSASSTMSTIPEKNDNDNKDAIRRNIDTAQAQMEEKKRILKAKIEEKKRKLMEKQQKKREEEARSKSPTPMSVPTEPSQGMKPRDAKRKPQRKPQSKPPSKPQTSNQSLAERNALRFAKHHNQTSTRPISPVPQPTTGNSKEREDLKDAVNLVGLCPAMCPDDELERRRNESDIQALEIPMPGTLHPPNWTLKDTAIKRFRRSAADYKLDVPEWVRPPEVLERTMGYLEEWIMERDRQGPDPRFPRKDIPPPPLDVYQFIWDRTRMIRKDFILQNYVGTGGRCDAKAVRCHERIARWHAMCEHQLSHIDDFVKMQSQQNMQELGQTMKTLNSFYDDAMGRSTKEVPDEKTGRETFVPDTNHTARASSNKNGAAVGGCLFDSVQGQNPMDYDGQLLNNAKNNPMISQRLIGENNNKTMARGTAEPEMRGMYMLLTMENEGGMEVLKYAAKLFKERPAVYHSPPVQLALTIFKTIKDMNYVKFFSILRSPTTPYLFACIMFKQVEIMRRIAIQIMSVTYGARNKNTGEAMYDVYPLERLMHILCFEDLTEARKTLEFYNITVKDYTSQRTGEVREVIFWKGSKFTVPRDPEKGHVLHLKPKKMIRTIESKLNGATRLAICRGEVSGKGAALCNSAKSSSLNAGAVPFTPGAGLSMMNRPSDVDSEAKAKELLMRKKLEQAKREQLAKQQKEMERQALEKRRKLELQQKEERRKKELEEKAKQAAEQERLRLKKLEEEKIRQQRLEEERLKKIREEEIARKMKEEKARKDAEEAARKQRELEEQRKREEQERLRLERERRIAEEKRLKQLEEERIRRKKEEERRREILRLELEAKRKREAEEKRKADEWRRKIDSAAKVLMWHRWKRVLSRPLEISVRSKNSLREIDPSFQTDSFGLAERIMMNSRQIVQAPLNQRSTSKSVIENLLRDKSVQEKPKLNVASMALEEIQTLSNDFVGYAGSQKSINLLKIALICPETMDVTDQSYASLLYHWVGTRINLGTVDIAKSESSLKFSSRHEVRAVVIRGSSYEACSSCDVALFLIPPHWSDSDQKARFLNDAATSLLDETIPRVALALNDDIDGDNIQRINNVIASELGANMDVIPVIQPSELSAEAFDGALKFALRRIASLFIREACVSIIRIPAMQLATHVVLSILWECIPSVLGGEEDEDIIVECSRLSLRLLMTELATLARHNEIEWSLWPAPEFSSHEDIVESYFAEDEGLPLQWTRCLSEEFLRETYEPLLGVFRGHFRDAYQRIVVDAPITVQDECASECAQGQYRRCLQKALVWMENSASDGCFIYLPEGMIDLVVKDVAAKVKSNLSLLKSASSMQKIPKYGANISTIDKFIFPKTTDRIDPSQSVPTVTRPASPVIENGSSLPGNKRTRSVNQLEHALKKTRREDEDALGGIAAPETSIQSSNDARRKKSLSESKSYTMRLERLLRGEETIDMTVGNTVLSRYLRDVPEPRVESKD